MKKCVLVVLAVCLTLTLGACVRQEDDGIVRPPVRQAGGMLIDYVRGYNLEEAMEEAELVVWVRIGNWLGEAGDYTRFEAQVLQCLKGDHTGTIEICQMGNSRCTVRGYPLFTYGNEKLLFLTYSQDRGWCMINDNQTVMDVVQCQDGKAYATPCFVWMLKNDGVPAPLKNYASDAALRQEICDVLTARDALYSGSAGNIEFVLSVEEMQMLTQ